MALQYIDKEGLTRFWKNTKEYVDEADKLLQEQIDSIIGGGASSVDELRDALNQEIADRQEADAALLGTEADEPTANTIHGLRKETSNLSESITSLREDLTNESQARQDAIDAVNTRIDEMGAGSEADLAELKSKVDQEILDRQEADTAVKTELLGTEEDSKESNTIHGLRAQIEFNAAEATGAISTLREEVLGDSSLLSEGKIPATHTLDAIKKEVEAEEATRTSEVTRLEGLITEASTADAEALSSLRNEIYGSEVEAVDTDHTLTTLKASKVDVEGGTASNLTVNNITASGVADFRGASTRVKTLTEEEAQTDKTENQGTAAASIQFVSDVVNSRISQAQALVYKGTIETKEDLETLENPSVGWMYKVTSDEIDFSNQSYINDNGQGYLAHQGDMIVCQVAGVTGNTAKWDIIKHNDDGQVIGPSTSAVDRIAVFTDGTGKAIKAADKTVSDIYTDLQAEIDSDVTAVKNELLGTGATSDDTIKGSKKYTDEQISSTKLSTVEVKAEGDSDPAGTFSDNKLSINLPKYRLESKASTQDINEVALNRVVDGIDESFKFENNKLELNLNKYIPESKLGTIEGTIQDYVDSKASESIISNGTIDHETPDNESETISIDAGTIRVSLNKYALKSDLDESNERLTTAETDIDSLETKSNDHETRIKANETKLADVVDTTVGALIDSDVAAAKSSLIGTDSDASTADTIFGAKKRADEVKAELQESITTLNSETIKTITISEDASDEGPTAVTSTNTVALHLPNYRLESEAAAKDIIKGTLLKVSDDVHEDITVEDNTVILSLHNYASKEVQAELDDRITALEDLTAGSWRAQNDEGMETNTIKEYVDLKAARIPDSEITALMDRMNV